MNKKLFLVFVFLASFLSAGFAEVKPKAYNLQQCAQDEDCIAFKECCSWEAINKKFIKEYQKAQDRACAFVDCVGPPEESPGPVECKDTQCIFQAEEKELIDDKK